MKSDIKVEVTAPENGHHSDSESSEDEVVEHNEEAIQAKEQVQTECAPVSPTEASVPKKDKKASHKQKEIVVDKTKQVTTGTIERKKAKSSNSNAGSSGFFSKFKRKSEKEKEAEIEHDKAKKAEKEKKEHDRKEKERAEKERKQREKEEKDRKKKEKKKKDGARYNVLHFDVFFFFLRHQIVVYEKCIQIGYTILFYFFYTYDIFVIRRGFRVF